MNDFSPDLSLRDLTENFLNEKEYRKYLEEIFFPKFFDSGWKPIKGETHERNIRRDSSRSRIDYFGFKNKIPTYVEVKNDRIRQKYLLQIVRYFCECNEEHHEHDWYHPLFNNEKFNFYVICIYKIREHREEVLYKLGIKILDLKEVCSGGLDIWM